MEKAVVIFVVIFCYFNTAFCQLDSNSTKVETSDLFITQKEFFYADKPRSTFLGGLPYKENNPKLIPTIGLGAVVFGFYTTQHIVQMNTIWEEQSKFKIMEDGRYALYADKAGHFFGTYLTSYFWTEALMSVGYKWETSAIIGTIMGLTYTTYVEILDGYGKTWGFSPSDIYADIAGAALFIGQYYSPFLQNFTPKFQYIPANWHGHYRRAQAYMFIDDYSSHTLWLNVNVYNLLPDNMKKYWLPWLEISFGYAARNLCAPMTAGVVCPDDSEKIYPDVYGNPKFVIALDYDLVKILPGDSGFWNWLKHTLNYYKFPSPAIEFGKTTKFYLLYPFAF